METREELNLLVIDALQWLRFIWDMVLPVTTHNSIEEDIAIL